MEQKMYILTEQDFKIKFNSKINNSFPQRVSLFIFSTTFYLCSNSSSSLSPQMQYPKLWILEATLLKHVIHPVSKYGQYEVAVTENPLEN